ncbi:L-histidine N(alpha)-methyltransferase [Jannaschia donghaensis]|uniref:Histidine-specific methyltransferase EgtD n=1 Tax=Jannaschia donghaensis TaxID=420998 RepID=A0A0M6YM26_9RHOB|nr:L-histidine N(alpha)-methyltransferase [Jannaschia donghaensis]CTQ50954.1 Histidine-specific methyltransferase EgtD [Jannaschia donghaensis]
MKDLAANADLLADAIAGLTAPQKSLPPKWFYDRRGSDLFEQITGLPEYYPTRTEAAILRDHADHLAGVVPPGGALVELGSGASVKTRRLLTAGGHFGAYVPIDISEEFLMATAADLCLRYPRLSIRPVVADFTGPVDLPLDVITTAKVAFFPGSTIGNLDPAEAVALLSRVRNWPGVEGFILGVDLVKPVGQLIAAYDDSAGVTSEFNLNILSRLNNEVHADFDVDAFRHDVRWHDDPARIEMHLVSSKAQTVTLGDHVITFAKGESIHTESCRKYTADTLADLALKSGWTLAETLMDADARFAVAVLRPASG